MSLESLFQHILFSEHQAEEGRRLQREVRAEINRCRESIRMAAQTLKQEQSKLETKVQQFSEKSLLLQLLKTQENALERQCDEITSQRNRLLQTFETIKKKLTEEKEKFINEITGFNNEYEIIRKRKLLMKENVKIEISDLERQANTLKIDLEDKENEAICTTKHLEREKIEISKKPQNDAECLRLKKELDFYKDENMKSIYEALQTEIEFLELTLAQKELQKNH